ncbi:MAG: hypothetical protein V4681_02340 [Patescibacteria group bacterium]
MQKDYSKPGRYASAAPARNRDDGHYVLKHKDGMDHLVLEQPSVRGMCAPLMGASVWNGERWRAKYLPLSSSISIYERAMRVLAKWNNRDDIFCVAFYRRQVAYETDVVVDIQADVLFLICALQAQPPLTRYEWGLLKERMPDGSWIRRQCVLRTIDHEAASEVLLAAE